jgi:hypothetical protein
LASGKTKFDVASADENAYSAVVATKLHYI